MVSSPGGQKMTLDIKSGGVGLPESNPNLDSDVIEKIAEVIAAIKDGKIEVSDQQGDLF